MEDYALVIAGISAVTALVAVIVGPMVSLNIAKRQLNASVLSVNRQEWINTLRDQISELVAQTIILRREREVEQYPKEPDRIFARIEGVVRCALKIQLLINPKEADHVHLVKSISKLMILVAKTADKVEDKDRDSQLRAIRDEIVSKSQEVLKREWERVKEGK